MAILSCRLAACVCGASSGWVCDCSDMPKRRHGVVDMYCCIASLRVHGVLDVSWSWIEDVLPLAVGQE
jgi:spore maturation protein SpmB